MIFALSGITAFWIFAYSPNIRVGVASLAASVLYLSASVEMIRSRGTSRLRFTIGILCGLLSFVLLIRSWYGFFSYTEYSLMTSGSVQTLTFLQVYSLMFIGGIGFLLMLKENYDTILVESEEKYRTLVEKANEAIVIVKDERFVFANRRMSEILGLPEQEIISRKIEEFINQEDSGFVMGNYKKRLEGEFVPRIYDFRLLNTTGLEVWVTISATKIAWEGGEAVMALLTDITERKTLEKEKEKIIQDLQKALTDVKALSGLLPICSSCKKIRDDKGYWNQIEVYIRDHSEADFSHSLCPDCIEKLYPGFKTGKIQDKTEL
jgi:PAS domain S-box-containing protein